MILEILYKILLHAHLFKGLFSKIDMTNSIILLNGLYNI